MVTTNEIHEEEHPEVVNISGSQVDEIEADLVRTSRTYVNSIHAEEVDLYQAAAVDIDASQVNANSSLLGVIQDDSSVLNNSILLAGKTSKLETNSSVAGGIISKSTTINDNSKVGILVSRQVTGEKVNTILLVARNVQGPVETSLDTRQVAMAGILAGITSGLILMLGKFLFRRK